MIIKSVKLTKIKYLLLLLSIILLVAVTIYMAIFKFRFFQTNTSIENILNSNSVGENFINEISNFPPEELKDDAKSSYIKWVDFKGSSSILKKLSDLDITSHNNREEVKLNWIELMAYLGCKYGGNLNLFKQSDLDNLVANERTYN